MEGANQALTCHLNWSMLLILTQSRYLAPLYTVCDEKSNYVSTQHFYVDILTNKMIDLIISFLKNRMFMICIQLNLETLGFKEH